MKVPEVRSVMTHAPRVVDGLESTGTARALMEQYGIRHLPVMKNGELFGVVSDRDLRVTGAFSGHASESIEPPVMVICSTPPFVVAPDTPIDDVATEMANRKLGTAVVVHHERVVGIVTTVDICRALVALVGKLRAMPSAT